MYWFIKVCKVSFKDWTNINLIFLFLNRIFLLHWDYSCYLSDNIHLKRNNIFPISKFSLVFMDIKFIFWICWKGFFFAKISTYLLFRNGFDPFLTLNTSLNECIDPIRKKIPEIPISYYVVIPTMIKHS